MVTTPNRPVFSPGLGRGEKPTNPFHVEELDAEQLHDLLVGAGFTDVVVHGLHHGPRITDWEAAHGTGLVAAQMSAVAGHRPGAGRARRVRRIGDRARLRGRRARRRAGPRRRGGAAVTARTDEPVGTFCLVLHTHLPWLAHHGTWPVGEEWLYQAWATSATSPCSIVLRPLRRRGPRATC